MAKSAPKPNTGPDAPRFTPPAAVIRPRNGGVADGDPLRLAGLGDKTGGGLSPNASDPPAHKPIEP